jgi:hypothetical protein
MSPAAAISLGVTRGELFRRRPEGSEIVDHQGSAGAAGQRETVCPPGEREAVRRSITSIQNCNGTAGTRICEVGLEVAGHQRAYLVSLSITPIGDDLTVRGQ